MDQQMIDSRNVVDVTWTPPGTTLASSSSKRCLFAGKKDGEGQNRTGDTTIFSRVLYRLSYLAAKSGQDGSGGNTP
jgi:hypothetical protein